VLVQQHQEHEQAGENGPLVAHEGRDAEAEANGDYGEGRRPPQVEVTDKKIDADAEKGDGRSSVGQRAVEVVEDRHQAKHGQPRQPSAPPTHDDPARAGQGNSGGDLQGNGHVAYVVTEEAVGGAVDYRETEVIERDDFAFVGQGAAFVHQVLAVGRGQVVAVVRPPGLGDCPGKDEAGEFVR